MPKPPRRKQHELLFALTLAIFNAMAADEPASVEPALTPDAELSARIESLPDNTWLKLPPLKIAGDVSWCGKPDWPGTENIPSFGPGVRDYCNRMVWAPERKRALYCGGNHQTPNYINDVWEYDLPSNTWVCLYAPDPQYPHRLKETAVYKADLVQTQRGGPLRTSHTWWGLSYDTQRRRLLWLDPHQGLLFTDAKKIAAELGISESEARGQQGGAKDKKIRGPIVWQFDPAARKWDGAVSGLPGRCESCCLEFLPDQQALWMKGYGDTYLSDSSYKNWTQLTKLSDIGYAMVSAYDPEAKTVLIVSPTKTFCYSFGTREWKTVQEKAPVGTREAEGMLSFDSAARKFVLCTRMDPGGLWLYDLAKNEWSDPKPQGNGPVMKAGRMAGYYDPARNVTVYYSGREVWVYRAKRIEK